MSIVSPFSINEDMAALTHIEKGATSARLSRKTIMPLC
jgi:hypothetical protein